MKCRTARMRIVSAMLGEARAPEVEELADHLEVCERCRKCAATYGAIRAEIAELEPYPLPDQALEALTEQLRLLAESGETDQAPPADPRPERSTAQKVALVALAFLALALVTAGLLLVGRGEIVPVQTFGRVSMHAGETDYIPPGGSRDVELGDSQAVVAGCVLRSKTEGRVRVESQSATWCLDSMTVVQFGEPGTVNLIRGRLYWKGEAAEGEPLRIVSTSGTVSVQRGALVAESGYGFALATCVEGSASIQAGGETVELGPGQAAMYTEGGLVGEVRAIDVSTTTHWLHLTEPQYGELLTARHLGALPIRPPEPLLPENVQVQRLAVHASVRGPLVMLRLRLELRNTAETEWRGQFSAAPAILPTLLAESGPRQVVVGGGQSARVVVTALCSAPLLDGSYVMGLNPAAWTAGKVGQFELQLDATADGGLRSTASPLHGLRKTRDDHVRHRWSAQDVSADRPVIVEWQPKQEQGLDAIGLHGSSGSGVLVAWRGGKLLDRWLEEPHRALVGLDASADMGSAPAGYVQEVVHNLVYAISTQTATAMVGYEQGNVRLDPQPWSTNSLPRAEAILQAMWELKADAEADGGEPGKFLHACAELASGPQEGYRGTIALMLTGRPAAGDYLESVELSDRVRPVVVQIGATEAAPAYAQFCMRNGGMALALPARQPPRPGILAALSQLTRQHYVAVECSTKGATLLTRPGQTSLLPVTVLLPADRGDGRLVAHLAARTPEGSIEREVSLSTDSLLALSGAEAEALLRKLRAGGAR